MGWAQLVNTTTTLAGGALGARLGKEAGLALNNPVAGALLSGCMGVTGSYFGNLVFNEPSQKHIKEKIHGNVINVLISHGVDKEDAEQEFRTHDLITPPPRKGVIKNIGNIVCTHLGGMFGSGIGLLSSTALCTTLGKGLDAARGGGNRYASYGFAAGMLTGPIIGRLAGGYAGNSFFNDPDKKFLRNEAETFAQKIIEERNKKLFSDSPEIPRNTSGITAAPLSIAGISPCR